MGSVFVKMRWSPRVASKSHLTSLPEHCVRKGAGDSDQTGETLVDFYTQEMDGATVEDAICHEDYERLIECTDSDKACYA